MGGGMELGSILLLAGAVFGKSVIVICLCV
jgi:hypothetical protein